MANCYQWLTNNRLSMHMGKTETLVFSSRKNKHLVKDFELKCQEHIAKPLSKVKYLGLYLDQHLSSDVSVNSIVKECNNRLKFMYMYSKSLNQRSRKILTSALVQCHFDYAAYKLWKIKLQVAQNKMVAFHFGHGTKGAHWSERIGQVWNEQHW